MGKGQGKVLGSVLRTRIPQGAHLTTSQRPRLLTHPSTTEFGGTHTQPPARKSPQSGVSLGRWHHRFRPGRQSQDAVPPRKLLRNREVSSRPAKGARDGPPKHGLGLRLLNTQLHSTRPPAMTAGLGAREQRREADRLVARLGVSTGGTSLGCRGISGPSRHVPSPTGQNGGRHEQQNTRARGTQPPVLGLGLPRAEACAHHRLGNRDSTLGHGGCRRKGGPSRGWRPSPVHFAKRLR